MLNLLSTMADTSPNMSDEVSLVVLLVVYGIIFGGLFAVLFVYWLFKAIAIFKMSKKLNINMPWLSFVPYCLPFAYGRIAEMYNKNHFKKPIKYSILLLILQFVPGFLVFILYFFLFAIVFAAAALMNIPGMEVIAVILILLFYFIFFAVAMAIAFFVNLFNYLACWNVFAIFGGEKNVLLFIASITIGIEPFVLFALRNKEPQNLREEFVVPEIVEEN
ncbi:MAG: hypothetical protein J6B80_04535 [Clostridia bacterium]|nr:hypothetical protein [Clostridia bacterium]